MKPTADDQAGMPPDVMKASQVVLATKPSLRCDIEVARTGIRVRLVGENHALWHACRSDLAWSREILIGDLTDLNGRRRATWSELADLDQKAARLDWFLGELRWRAEALLDRAELPLTSLTILRTSLRLAQDQICLVDRAAIRVAQHFDGKPSNASKDPTTTRHFVYESIITDHTGRIAQVAQVCPGILILAKAMRDHGHNEPSAAVLAAVVRGERQSRVLTLALETWGKASLDGSQRTAAALFRDQRLRLTRAAARVPPDILWNAPPENIVPEDIPTDPAKNLLWFRVTSVSALSGHIRSLTQQQRAGFFQFASRWAYQLGTWESEDGLNGGGISALMAELRDYLAHSGRVPARNTKPEQLLEESARWHRTIAEAQMAVSPETPLATGPLTGLLEWTMGEHEFHLGAALFSDMKTAS